MTQSEELELKIFQFAESACKANWRAINLPLLSNAIQFHEDAVLIDALSDLHARAFMEFRQWSNERNGWIAYPGGDRRYFYREFQMRVLFSGRKYFERLEIQAQELARPTSSPRPVPGTEEDRRSGADSALPSTGIEVFTGPKAFVSHATQDHPFVEEFAAKLRANGVDAWFSKWEIKPGDSIRAKIDEGLEDCEYFIIVLSKSSIGRPWVQTELDAATIRKLSGRVRKIIPVKIEDCGDLPPTLASLCWEDFSNQPHEAALKRVLDSIFEVDVRPPLKNRAIEMSASRPEVLATPPYTNPPIVVVEIASKRRRLGEPMTLKSHSIRNIGETAALDVSVEPIQKGPFDIRFGTIPFLEAKQAATLEFTILHNLQGTGFSKMTVQFASILESGELGSEFPVTVVYSDVSARRYSFRHLVTIDFIAKKVTTTPQGRPDVQQRGS